MVTLYKLNYHLLRRSLNEHEYNSRAGFTKVDDRLPEMFKETLPPHNTTRDFGDEELQQVK